MSNFEVLLNAVREIPKDATYLAILLSAVGALIYFFGKIRSSHSWQYHLDERQVPILNGIVGINNVVFIPILAIWIVVNFFSLINLTGLLLAALFFVDVLTQNITLRLVKDTTKNKKIEIDLEEWLFALKARAILIFGSIALYLITWWILSTTENRGILVIVLAINFLCILRFVHWDNIADSRKKVNIKLKGKKEILEDARIIEFLNGGEFCKIQHKQEILAIPTESIELIKLK